MNTKARQVASLGAGPLVSARMRRPCKTIKLPPDAPAQAQCAARLCEGPGQLRGLPFGRVHAVPAAHRAACLLGCDGQAHEGGVQGAAQRRRHTGHRRLPGQDLRQRTAEVTSRDSFGRGSERTIATVPARATARLRRCSSMKGLTCGTAGYLGHRDLGGCRRACYCLHEYFARGGSSPSLEPSSLDEYPTNGISRTRRSSLCHAIARRHL